MSVESQSAKDANGVQRSAQRGRRTAGASEARTPGRSAPRVGPGALAALQRQAGNRAVSGLLGTAPATAASSVDTPTTAQRLVEGQPPGRSGPDADPKFAALKRDVASKRARLAAHKPAAKEADAAARAARPPQDDTLAQGKAAQADTMAAAKPGEFDKPAFIKALGDAIAQQAPKNLSEAMDYGSSGKADAVKAQVSGKVGQGTASSKAQIATATGAVPETDKAKPKAVVPIGSAPAVGAPAGPDPARAVPDRAPDSATDFSEGPRQVDSQLSAAEVTEEQLAKSNEPEFHDALTAKKEGEAHAATAPASVRLKEAEVLDGAKAGAAATGKVGMAGMAADALRGHKAVHAGKGAAQARDEQRRAQATALLQKVFDATKRDVEAILTGLDTTVDEQFTREEKVARDAFTAEHQRRMDEYKDDRYSGLRGKYRWVRDKFKGLPEGANKIFEAARAGYVNRLQGVISRVADTIGTELARAKQRIAEGRTQLQAEVAKMPADLRKQGAAAAKEFSAQFDDLTQSVDAKSEELVTTLAGKYSEALGSVDEEIEKEKEANKGLIAKAMDAVVGVIKTILQLKDMLLGVLARAAGVIGSIISDPIGFLGNFVNAVKTGVMNFADRIGEHLSKGLKAWLFGSLADAGVEIPEKFDLRGIIQLVLSVLGLTWKSIRARITKSIPEPVMQKIEQSVDVFKILVGEGVGGLWKFVVDKVGDIEEMVIGQLKDFVITKIIKAGITWLISLLNPVAAFIKACKAIYEIVMFFVEKAAQIKEFVDAVLDSVEAIVSGGVGAVADKIENALAKLVPVLIGFLASLLGVGGITEKIKQVLDTVRKPVAKAIDGVIKGALKLAGPIIRGMSRGASWVKGKVTAGKDWVKGKADAGKAWVRGQAERLRGGRAQPAHPGADQRSAAQKERDLNAAIAASEAVMDRPGADEKAVAAALPAIRSRFGLRVLTIQRPSPGVFHVHGEINPRADSKDRRNSRQWRLAAGGFEAHEGRQFVDANGVPMVNRRGDPIHVHLITRHLELDRPDVEGRVTQGNNLVATGFLSAAVMERAVHDCLANRATEIEERLTREGKRAGDGTNVMISCSLPYKCGYGFALFIRPSQANKPVGQRIRDATQVAESDLASVTVIIRVSNSERGEYMVETAYPTPR
jgi:Skp family chaperone for outer membrane proteins